MPDPKARDNRIGRFVRMSQALAFEDLLAGARSAVAAGLHTFGMLAGLAEDPLREAGAQRVIRDFDDERLWALISERSPQDQGVVRS